MPIALTLRTKFTGAFFGTGSTTREGTAALDVITVCVAGAWPPVCRTVCLLLSLAAGVFAASKLSTRRDAVAPVGTGVRVLLVLIVGVAPLRAVAALLALALVTVLLLPVVFVTRAVLGASSLGAILAAKARLAFVMTSSSATACVGNVGDP